MHSRTFSPRDFAWQGLTLTPTAAIHIRELVTKRPGMVGVRLGVKQAGCVGFSYVLDSVSKPDKNDLLSEHDGTRLFALLQAMPFIDGMEVDFIHEGLNQVFRFHNPKAQNGCGCGESFGAQAILCLVILEQLAMSKPEPTAR